MREKIIYGTIVRYDDSNNLIYYKSPDGYELWNEYDENGPSCLEQNYIFA